MDYISNYIPVMETRGIEKMDGLVPYRDKFILPFDPNNPKKGRMNFTLNTSLSGVAAVLKGNALRILNRSSSYRTYFYDHTSMPTAFTGSGIQKTGKLMKDAKADRLDRYNKLGELVPDVRTPILPKQTMGFNVIYDLNPIVEIMRENKKLQRKQPIIKAAIFFSAIWKEIRHAREILGSQYSETENVILVDLSDPRVGTNDFHILTQLICCIKKKRFIEQMKRTGYNFKVIFYTESGYFLFDMQEHLDVKHRSKLNQLLKRVGANVDATQIENEISLEEVQGVLNDYVSSGFTGDGAEEDEIDALYNAEPEPIARDSEVVSKVASKLDDDYEDPEESVDAVLKDMNEEEADEFRKDIVNSVIDSSRGRHSVAASKRDELLREKQKKIQIQGRSIEELTKKMDIPKIPKRKVKTSATSIECMKDVKFANMDRVYNEEIMERDIANAFTSFNNKTIDMNVISVNVEDTSDSMNLKKTYTVVYEDEMRRRHSIKVDIPIVFDDSYLYLNGNTKLLENQITALPVIKTDQNTVRINTDYNKLTIVRKGNKLNPNIEKFKKMVEDPNSAWKYHRGNNSGANRKHLTCLEYDMLAQRYNEVHIGSHHFVFSVEMLLEETGNKYESTLDKILIGYQKKGKEIIPYWYDKRNPSHVDLVSTIILYAVPEQYDTFKAMSSGKKFIFTTTSIMHKEIPTVVLLCFFEGLSTVIRKFDDTDVQFVDKKSNRDNYMYIKLADGYIQYPMSNMEACIMFNGLTTFNTQNYTLSDLDNRQTYIEVLTEVCGDGYVAGALVNFYDFMINPFAENMLEILNLPTDLVSLIIYANNLLADNQYTPDLHMSNYRLRRNEVIASILYKQLTIAYSRYRTTSNNANPAKMSLDQACVIKELQKLQTNQDYNYSGPMTEVKMKSLATMVGYAGMNNERAYKMDKRMYDESMLGIVGVSTDNAKNCGKERHLVVEPNVINARGMIEVGTKDGTKEMGMPQLATGIELLNPGGLYHDDPVRTAMATKQRGSAIPVKDQCPMLISTGMDATIHYRTGDDYSVVARQDGTVLDVDDAKMLMTIEYKDGTKRCIDLGPKMAKNGGAGMFLKKQLQTKYKKGEKFKQDDILAYDPMFYNDNEFFGNRLTVGTLICTAIASNAATYEDSDFFTKKMSKQMASEITMCKTVIVGKTANVDYLISRGAKVKVGDDLIRFETAYDDAELNRLLAGIRDDLHEEIVNLGKTKIVAKYEGWVDDVVCYPTIPLEDMTPSLAKIVKETQKLDKDRATYLNKVDPGKEKSPYKAGCMVTKPVGVVTPDVYGKIEGEDVTDAVMFKIYITYLDEISDGDKIVHQTANKGTMGDMVPLGYEPRTAFRPYEEISTFQAPSAILARGTISIEPSMLHYKGLIELKRKLYEMATGESWNEKMRRENPYMDTGNKSVAEAMTLEEAYSDYTPSEPLMEHLSNVFHIGLNEDGHMVAETVFDKGDFVMGALYQDGTMDRNSLEFCGLVTKFAKGSYNRYNAYLDYTKDAIVATEQINPGDEIVVLR